MTIAISIKVNDGVVLAADSASTIIGQNTSGISGVIKIYENANKIFNLKKGLPIGAITWGSGSIGQASISTLAKDFRYIASSQDPERIDPANYSVEGVAQEFKKFIFDENYRDNFKDWKDKPPLGFMIVGYSSNQPLAEEWKIDIKNGECTGPYKIRDKNEIGITWNGEIEAIHRLFFGFGTRLPDLLKQANLEAIKIEEIMNLCRKNLVAQMILPPMPIQDAIDLAVYLAETTVRFSRFSPGAPTVGGPIEVAAITKYEGFKWINRKQYFSRDLNP